MIKDFIDCLDGIVSNPTIIFIGAITFIEVAPIRINPWGWLFSHIGNALNKNLREDIGDLKEEIKVIKTKQTELKHELDEDRAQTKRRYILEFANSCRRHEEHDHEEWNNVIADIYEYKKMVEEKNLDNGVIEEATKYLLELHHDRYVKNDFL